jgi:hypothetical protein
VEGEQLGNWGRLGPEKKREREQEGRDLPGPRAESKQGQDGERGNFRASKLRGVDDRARTGDRLDCRHPPGLQRGPDSLATGVNGSRGYQDDDDLGRLRPWRA